MKQLFLYLMLLIMLLGSCQLNNINPVKKILVHTNDTPNTPDPIGHGNVAGTWKWSAQYSYGYPHTYILDPTNTGIQETLNFGADSTWTQTQNNKIVNTGTYKLVNVFTPAGPDVFFSVFNNLASNPARYDNFDFNKGFIGSYAASNDSLIFYGVYTIGAYTNLASERVYVK